MDAWTGPVDPRLAWVQTTIAASRGTTVRTLARTRMRPPDRASLHAGDVPPGDQAHRDDNGDGVGWNTELHRHGESGSPGIVDG